MTLSNYYQMLGLPVNSSLEEIKKAYRRKARLYHPDLNNSPDAKEMFILVTEAYEFLVGNYCRISENDDAEYRKAMEEWRKYRQDRSRQKARIYAQASYLRFKKTQFYKTTRILDGTLVIFSLIISIMVIIYTVLGYNYRLKHPLPEIEQPSVFIFVMLLLLGLIFFMISVIYLKAYLESSGKHKKKPCN
jgi:hypothetical protein